jgi:hypothetical protein
MTEKQKITDEMKIGWNACRRQVYLLAEHIQDRKSIGAVDTDFERGERYMAKRFAKAFNAFEAEDCDFLIEAANAAALAAHPEVHGNQIAPVDVYRILRQHYDERPITRDDLTKLSREIAALAAALQPESVPVAVPSLDTYCRRRKFLLLASYCGGDADGCTEEDPCIDCVRMCNVYDETGTFAGGINCVSAASPDSSPIAAKDDASQERLRKLEAAATAFLNMYVDMVNSGDCGFWNPEEEPEVIDLRAALTKDGESRS